MFARQPRIELDLLQPPTGQDISEDEFVARTMDRMNRAFKVVQKQIKKNLDYRIKEYSPDNKTKYEIGHHVLVFCPARKKGETAKLKRSWSLPFQ